MAKKKIKLEGGQGGDVAAALGLKSACCGGCKSESRDVERDPMPKKRSDDWKSSEAQIEASRRGLQHAEETFRRHVVYCKARCTDDAHVPGCNWFSAWRDVSF